MSEKVSIDVIILSYAKDDKLKSLTEQTIQTLLASEDSDLITFNILVIESNKKLFPYQFDHTSTIYPTEEFGFHKFLNIGINATSNKYVCLCNNDLIFHENWASEILDSFRIHPTLKSVNPLCTNFNPTQKYLTEKAAIFATKKNIFEGILTGWCIFIERDLFNVIGFLDEQFDFWYADRDYGQTLLKHNINHALIPRSRVTHLGNQSHDSIDDNLKNHYTLEQKSKYDKKWNNGPLQKIKKYFQKSLSTIK